MDEKMLTIKEFADSHGKSVQSVYKQLKSKENAAALKGHIHAGVVGNKPAQLLDPEAVRILEAASAQAPQVIVQTNDKERIEEDRKKIEALLAEIARITQEAREADNRYHEAHEKLLQIESHEQDYQQVKERAAALETENATLRSTADQESGRAAALEKELKEITETLDLYKKDEAERNSRTFFQRLTAAFKGN